ncbi:hypothetical protein GCM10020258_03560 [Sphingomonas yabuuchiae]
MWADDVESGRVIDLARARGNKLVTVGTRGSTLKLVERHPTLLGQGLVIEDEHGQAHKVQLPLIGAYQAANALVAAGLVLATGGDLTTTIANLSRLQPVRGRLERAAIARSGRRSMSTMPIPPTRSRRRSPRSNPMRAGG